LGFAPRNRIAPVVPPPTTARSAGRRCLAAAARHPLARVQREWEESEERTFAICQNDDVLIGAVTVGLHERGAVGYWLDCNMRGRGLMTEAVTAVVRWACEMYPFRPSASGLTRGTLPRKRLPNAPASSGSD
jgi:Acetyltransferase (GNAT) domain